MKRPAFTLIEVLVAVVVMSVVVGGSMTAFMGMRKSQGLAVSNTMMRVSGQKAIKDIYLELSQARKLLASNSQAPASQDIGRDYFDMFGWVATDRPIAATARLFPRIDENGAFGLEGSKSGELERDTVGNTLVFMGIAKNLRIATPGITIKLPLLPPISLSSAPYFMPALKFLGYYMDEKPLPTTLPAFDKTRKYTQRLMRFESRPYLEKSEFDVLATKLGLPLNVKTVWDDLVATHDIAGIWDSSAAKASDAFWTVNGLGVVTKVVKPTIARKRVTDLSQLNLDPYAVGTVAFNTSKSFQPIEDGQTMAVPAYGPQDTAHANYPYGFEVAITGPSGARSVLVRLSLAARLSSGQHLFGLSHQTVVKVLDL